MTAFITQNRMADFMNGVGLTDVVVDAFATNAGESLCNKIAYCLEKPDHLRLKYRAVRSRLRSEAKEFHSKIQSLILSVGN